jgi:3',5'-cyclic AMP phosphodiesterase CpdA
MFSILHISDLHRSREEPVDNNSLLAALLADRDRYAGETPRVPPPEAIIVSGDLIQGAQIGVQNWQQSMKDQYAVADGFLTALCKRFLDGDKSRMVVVPGNHDVCWNTSHVAMERVPAAEYPKDLYGALIEPDSSYRWSGRNRLCIASRT